MSLAEAGAQHLIANFGENVEVTEMDNEVPDDADDPIFIDSSGQEQASETHKVRLYTTPSEETLKEFGFDEDTDSMMYSTDEIASEGDKVEYSPMNYDWIVSSMQTNQIGEGPYIFVYALVGT